ncbi:Integrator complex subunit 1 [Hypsibius exemplaris]|uniref:Integrator complex subunit 1 n=1 Tax=Hypsibius exemplaris TaxID=2072580 RepID=A0A1W0WKZ6_HYPEX|nr:Integrator complex subunit 1 [Hypsibius exemplaris]
MSADGPGGPRRPGAPKASGANLPPNMTFMALGPKRPPNNAQRPNNAAAALFGMSEARPIGAPAAGMAAGSLRRTALLGSSDPVAVTSFSASSSSTVAQRIQAAAKPVPVAKTGGVAARPLPLHSFPRAAPAGTKSDPARKVEVKEWMKAAVDTDSRSFQSVVKMVVSGDSSMGESQIAPMICGAVKQLVQNRHKEVDELLVMTLFRLAALKPEYFRTQLVRAALVALVKKEQLGPAAALKGRISAMNCVIGVNLLYAVYRAVARWPIELMKLYIEDAAMDRQWVDLAECQDFVRAIRVSFETRAAAPLAVEPTVVADPDSLRRPGMSESPRHHPLDDGDPVHRLSSSIHLSSVGSSGAGSSPVIVIGGDDSDSNFSSAASSSKDLQPFRRDRFESNRAEIQDLIMEGIKEATKRGNEGGKHLTRFLISTAGVPPARAFGMQRIDAWLQNAKTANVAMTLMTTICANCSGTSEEDLNIISTFLKIRMKSKSQTDVYYSCLNELIGRNPLNLQTIIRTTFDTEMNDIMMAKRNQWTLSAMAAAFKYKPQESVNILANFFAEAIVTHMDDSSRSLKLILHDLAKVHKADIRLDKFIHHFLGSKCFTGSAETKRLRGEDQSTRDKKLLTVIDIILAAEALIMITRHKEEMSTGHHDAFINAIASLQDATINFLRKTHGPALFSLSPDALKAAFRKIFFLDKATHFQILDKWPIEHERLLFFKVAARIPITSDILWQLRVQMSGCDTMMLVEMIELLLVRALSLRAEEYNVLKLTDLKLDFMDTILDLGVYRPLTTPAFPPKYRPPILVRKDIYWQCWKLVLLLAAAEPSVFGVFAWEYMPMAKALIQMLIINRFTFPPETALSAEKDVRFYGDWEQKLVEEERKAIVDYENREDGGNAKKIVVTEANSRKLKDYMRFDPKGHFRYPPESFLKVMESLGRTLDLGKIFSGCRNPDFLLDILNEKGTAASLPWLLEITTSSKSMFDVLPVECVCEMLSNSLMKTPTGTAEKREQDLQKCRNLAIRLSDSVRGDSSDLQNVQKTLDFFCDRLRAPTAADREIARTGLEIVFDPNRIESAIWGTTAVTDQSQCLPETRPEILPQSKHGISIEHLLARTRPNAWCPDFIVEKPCKAVSYTEKYGWLLADVASRGPHFPALKDSLCLQISKALTVESDALTVCAYIEFLATYLTASCFPQSDITVVYLVVQQMADVIVNRRDLRDAILLGRDAVLSGEDVQRVSKVITAFFETFLLTSVEVTPMDLGGTISQLNDTLISTNCKIDNLGRTACLTLTIARALPIITSFTRRTVIASSAQDKQNVLAFCLDRAAVFGAKECLSGNSLSSHAILTTAVRECIFRYCGDDRLVDIALHEVPTDLLIELVCCENIPLSNLHKLIRRLEREMDSPEVIPKLKQTVSKNALVTRTLLEYRLAKGLALDEPIPRIVKSTLDDLTNIFSTPFTA